jgi:hypothetical protein
VLQGALLLLLFRGSHQLEHRLTEKAAGGLQRLFDSVPDRAVVVEVEEGSNAPKVATSQEVRICCCYCYIMPGRQLVAVMLAHIVTGSKCIVKAGFGQFLLQDGCYCCACCCSILPRSRCQPARAATQSSWFSLQVIAYVCDTLLHTVQVGAADVSIGQHVLVRPGEQVPLDGIITWGTANLSLQVSRVNLS